jgi:GNAT superfamily N-acetyltransferase
MNLPNIRQYQSRDKDAVYQLHVTALKTAGTYIGSGVWDRDFENIEEIYIRSGGEFLVGELDGLIVSMGALRPHSTERVELKRMRVLPELQRKGFGQQMYEALEQRARELGFTTLYLDVTEKQQRARKFYEKNGFVLVGHVVLGGQDTALYEKKLFDSIS